jgi:nucleoside-diphosphate-sugar epimerase
MPTHVVVGAGPIGSATARRLSDLGHRVLLVTRSGTAPDRSGVEAVRADASDPETLTQLTKEAAVLYNCANPAYHRWTTDWPPLANAMLIAAERSGAVLATVSNLYGYGEVTTPMTEQTPLNPVGPKGRVRAQMWADALAAHQAGRVRAVEVRSADYVGPHAQSHLGDRVVPRLLAGKSVQVLRSADTPHSWSYTEDVAHLLVTVGSDSRAWGRPWHVPGNPPRSQREAVGDLCRIAGLGTASVSEASPLLMKALGLVIPAVRELREVEYQLTAPFLIDDSAARRTFGLSPTPWDDVLAATLDSYRSAGRG